MTSSRFYPSKSHQIGHPHYLTRALGLVTIVVVGLTVSGCGRRGAPEFVSDEPIAKTDTSNQLVPGLGLPQKTEAKPAPQKPKGTFILDPLL